MAEKGSLSTVVTETEFSLEKHDGTPHDQHDMRRVGKTQELNVIGDGVSQGAFES
jgi:hypothetical protein